MQAKYTVKENYSEPTNFYLPLTNATKSRFLKTKKVKEIVSITFYSICVAILMWIFFSFVDVIMHNTSVCQYAWWNFFTLIF